MKNLFLTIILLTGCTGNLSQPIDDSQTSTECVEVEEDYQDALLQLEEKDEALTELQGVEESTELASVRKELEEVKRELESAYATNAFMSSECEGAKESLKNQYEGQLIASRELQEHLSTCNSLYSELQALADINDEGIWQTIEEGVGDE